MRRLISTNIFLVLLLLVGCASTSPGEKTVFEPLLSRERDPAVDYDSVRRKIVWDMYRENQTTFYCGCEYKLSGNPDRPKGIIQHSSCTYVPETTYEKYRNEVQWEHILPASWFGDFRACWARENCASTGRECCRTTDEEFRMMEADLHNLTPSIGELNNKRGNIDYGELPDEPTRFGCQFKLTSSAAEPAPDIRGDIARVHFYMELEYGYYLGDENYRRLMAQWHRSDPVSEWERRKNEIVVRLQGNRNPYIH